MKALVREIFGVVLFSAIISLGLCAEDPPPGYIDFGKYFPPPSSGEFVEVNIGNSLISMTARLVEKDEPEIANLIRGLQRIRVNVIGLDKRDRADIEARVKALRDELDAQGWERVVGVRQKGQDVGVHVKTDGGEAVQGLAVTVVEAGRQAVLVNIVGDLRPEKLAVIGERFNIEPLKKIGVGQKNGA